MIYKAKINNNLHELKQEREKVLKALESEKNGEFMTLEKSKEIIRQKYGILL